MSYPKSLGVAGNLRDAPSRVPGGDGIDRLAIQFEILRTRLVAAVIYAGKSTQDGAVINLTGNTRAWQSYEAVARDIAASLERLGLRRVSLVPEDIRLGERLRAERAHLAWLNSGGVQGRHPMAHATSLLEMAGMPYVGHDPMTAGMLDCKHVFKRQLQALGLPTPRFVVRHLHAPPLDPRSDAAFRRVFGAFPGPFVVKPTNGRASLNVRAVEDVGALRDAVDQVRRDTQNHVLVEEFMPGREYCIAACGPVVARDGFLERLDGPFAFAACERVLDADERIFTSKDVRPITRDRVRLLDRRKDAAVLTGLESLARRVYELLDLESIVRLDVRTDRDGRLSILEANPKPDLKAPDEGATSLVCEALPAYGMSYDDLILSLLTNRIDVLLNRPGPGGAPLRAVLQAV